MPLDFQSTPGLKTAARYLLRMRKGSQRSVLRKAISAEILAELQRLDAIASSGLPGSQDLPEIKALAVCRAWCGGDWAKAADSYAQDHLSALFSEFPPAEGIQNDACLLSPIGAAKLALALKAAEIDLE